MKFELDKINMEVIACMAHNVNKAYCEAIGDFSQVEWSDAPDWQQQSAINGVNFHYDNPDAGPSASHNDWLQIKLADGWVYGEEKSAENKTHPCIMPYEQLPQAQQIKDAIFCAVVKNMITARQPCPPRAKPAAEASE